ncbi:MAG: ABC transporter ATP-binding protein/permease [Acidobacteriota bacterium]|nr:ABC transporter ATP-binding protein/permease [Acidobacteriota bacterium]
MLRHFWPWIRQERPLIAGSLTALLLGVVLRLAEPWPLKFVLDLVLGQTSDGPNSMTVLTLAAVSVIAVTVLRAFCDYHQKVGFAKIGNRVLRRVRTHLYKHLQTLSLSFHTGARNGDLLIRATRDVGLLRDVTSTALLPMLASLLVLIGMLTVVLYLQWQLALLAAATVPFFVFSTTRLSSGIHQAARKQRTREGAMASTASESLHAIRDVQALSLQDTFTGEFANRNAQSQKEDLKAARLSAQLGRSVDVLGAIATALVLWYGAVLVMRQQMTAGDFIVFLTYLKRAFKPARDFAKHAGRLAKATAAGERVMAVLQTDPEVRDRPDAIVASPFEGHIEFRDVSFGYAPDSPEIIRGLSFSIASGSEIAITGPSGSGKSTIVSLLLRLYDPTSGSVMVDGRDVSEYSVFSLRSQIGVVLQDAALFSGTVADNISVGSTGVSRQSIEWAAGIANADEFIGSLPQGYDSLIGERGATLSRGQRQRIAIARAVLRRTPILILDEPTTGLDHRSAHLVSEALAKLPRDMTRVIVTHDTAVADQADVVLHIESDHSFEFDTPTALRELRGAFHRLHAVGMTGGE